MSIMENHKPLIDVSKATKPKYGKGFDSWFLPPKEVGGKT